jgi:protein-disulfide isomerase
MEEIQTETEKIKEVQLEPIEVNKEVKKEGPLSIPVAIIIAGAFIGLGMFLSGGKFSPSSSGTTTHPVPKFLACLDAGTYAAHVQTDEDNAIATGGQGTPWSILIASNGAKVSINGAQPYAAVKKTVEDALAGNILLKPSGLDKMTPVTAADHIRGNIGAKVTIVEYSDLECPFCKIFHATLKQIMSEHTDGSVAWVYRHYPLDSLHPRARKEAEASECAFAQGGNDKFWAYIDRVYEITTSNNTLDPLELPMIASYIGLK